MNHAEEYLSRLKKTNGNLEIKILLAFIYKQCLEFDKNCICEPLLKIVMRIFKSLLC